MITKRIEIFYIFVLHIKNLIALKSAEGKRWIMSKLSKKGDKGMANGKQKRL